MNNWLKATAFCLIGLATTGAYAQKAGLSLQLADETARVGILSEADWMSEIYRFEAGFQYNNNKDYVVDASMLYTNKGLVDPNLDLGFKAKGAFIFLDEPDSDTYGALLGIYGRYWLPTPVPSALVAQYLLSPQILTFGDGKAMRELMVRGQVQLLRNMNGFVGYRRFSVEFDNLDTVELDDGVHIGIELSF
jgi:hypothetical protein